MYGRDHCNIVKQLSSKEKKLFKKTYICVCIHKNKYCRSIFLIINGNIAT